MGPIAHAVSDNNGLKIITHGIDHGGPNAAGRGASGDEHGVHVFGREPTLQARAKEGRGLGLRVIYSPSTGARSLRSDCPVHPR